jgi:hypothetical protein
MKILYISTIKSWGIDLFLSEKDHEKLLSSNDDRYKSGTLIWINFGVFCDKYKFLKETK